jgi:hypothetical protein
LKSKFDCASQKALDNTLPGMYLCLVVKSMLPGEETMKIINQSEKERQ